VGLLGECYGEEEGDSMQIKLFYLLLLREGYYFCSSISIGADFSIAILEKISERIYEVLLSQLEE